MEIKVFDAVRVDDVVHFFDDAVCGVGLPAAFEDGGVDAEVAAVRAAAAGGDNDGWASAEVCAVVFFDIDKVIGKVRKVVQVFEWFLWRCRNNIAVFFEDDAFDVVQIVSLFKCVDEINERGLAFADNKNVNVLIGNSLKRLHSGMKSAPDNRNVLVP